MPMLGVVLDYGFMNDSVLWYPFLFDARQYHFLAEFLALSKTTSISFAARVFDVPEQTIVAWKAHATRGTYSKSEAA
jgi:hypothetical protein